MPEIKALFFDQDGVIIDTERDGHRVAFNQTFREFGFDFQWGVEDYHQLLQVSGGKERMRHYLHTEGFGKPVDPSREGDLIKRMHKRKTEIFIGLLEEGKLPLRPGVRRLMNEAMQAGLVLGVCTTSNIRSAHAVAHGILSDIDFDFVLAGDMVEKKKPHPEIYHLALEKTGLQPEQCLVVEDSRNGVLAARAAGMNVLATTNVYTEREDLSDAAIIVSCMGDPGGQQAVLTKPSTGLELGGVVHLATLVSFFS